MLGRVSRRPRARRPAIVPLFLALLVAGAASLRASDPAPRWYKGCTHVHTLWSDGDGAPELVVDWYREHGYHFAVLSDHDLLQTGERWFPVDDATPGARLTSDRVDALRARFGADAVTVREVDGVREMRLLTLAELRRRFDRPGEFLLIPGEEISDGVDGKPVHVNGLGLAEPIAVQGGASVRAAAERNMAAVVAQGERLGIPVLAHLNHPSFHWAFTSDDLAELRGERFFEVYNGHPATNFAGDPTDAARASGEELWARANARRRHELDLPLLHGLATDDAHAHHVEGPAKSNCGRGWIVVRARELSAGALFEAMRAGDFYASTGVALDDVRFDGATLTVDVAADEGVTYTTRFTGSAVVAGAGRPDALFLETTADPARYALTGEEGYVRATVVSSRPQANPVTPGEPERAWTQPVRVE
jgi:hypothetical protein